MSCIHPGIHKVHLEQLRHAAMIDGSNSRSAEGFHVMKGPPYLVVNDCFDLLALLDHELDRF